MRRRQGVALAVLLAGAAAARSPAAVTHARAMAQATPPGPEAPVPDTARLPQATETVATRHFAIQHAPGSESAADLAAFADVVFEGLVAATGVQLAEPITIRLYETRGDLVASQPMAAEVDGVLVTSPRASREIALVATDGDLRSGLRRGLGFMVATDVGAGSVPDLWAIGFADFLAGPDADTASSVARLRTARDMGALHGWADLALPAGAFLDPPVTYPLAESAVHYLATRGGLPLVMDYLRGLGAGRSWQAALEAAFDLSASEAEMGWRVALDDYLDGGWRRHPLYPDSVPAAALDPTALGTQTAGAAAFVGVDNAELGAALDTLGARTAALISAGELLVQSESALQDGRYQEALDLSERARAAAPDEPGSPQARAAEELARRARMGLSAETDLSYAESAPVWTAPIAVARALRARSALAAIGNEAAARRASEVRARWAALLAAAGLALVMSGSVALGHAAWRARRDAREAAGPLRT